jgi:hypothetical protein
VIVDDLRFAELFDPWQCPSEELLGRLYVTLGSRNLSNQVSSRVVVNGQCKPSADAERLRRDILERRAVFMHQRGRVPRRC